MSKKVCGVGVNDMKGRWCCSPKGGCKSVPYNEYQFRCYTLWKSILTRSYVHHLSIVCDRWKLFSNFIKDLPFIPGYKRWLANLGKRIIYLDKDSKYYGNKVYDPSTVCFITERQSSLEMIRRCGVPIINNPQINCRPVVGISVNNPQCVLHYPSATDAEKDGFSQQHISHCCHGKRKTHKGYYWKFL